MDSFVVTSNSFTTRLEGARDSGVATSNAFTTQAETVGKTVLVQIEGVGARIGLRYAFFDDPNPAQWDAPSAQGEDGETDSNGSFSIAVPESMLSDGEWGYLYITDNDGTLSASSHHGAPAQVREG